MKSKLVGESGIMTGKLTAAGAGLDQAISQGGLEEGD